MPHNRAPAVAASTSPDHSAPDDLALNESRQARLDQSMQDLAGSPAWKRRKQREAHDLLALEQRAPHRLQVLTLDLNHDLRVHLKLRVPVPCAPDFAGHLRVEPLAILGLVLPELSMSTVLPGSVFVQVIQPLHVFHPNVYETTRQICLGLKFAPGEARVRELILMTYGALSMQTALPNPYDHHGIAHHRALQWWRDHLALRPLSRAAFFNREPTEELL
jgi:hypothetical protein